MTPPDHEFVYPAAASIFALVGAGFDIRCRRIPNFVTGPAMLAGLLLHLSLDGWFGMLTSLSAGLLCGLVFLVFYLAGGMGAGDVKLITAAGALVGLSNSASLLIVTALVGGLMGLVFALLRGQLRSTFLNVQSIATHHMVQGLIPHPEHNVRNRNSLRLPYGVAIAAGSCITLYLQGFQR